jgi:RHS repeat-associated protein
MLLPNRNGSSVDYRYGFNGMEGDDEISGEGNSYDFGARMMNPRVGRWFTPDPKASNAPSLTPYRFGFNNPVRYLDPDGEYEIDGHFWTVLAYGIAKGLSVQQSIVLAVAAEHLDHHVHGDDFEMSTNPGTSTYANILRKVGVDAGTWSDGGDYRISNGEIYATAGTQQFGHGLTGGPRSEVIEFASQMILFGKLTALHTLGDAYAHSYKDDEGNWVMYGTEGGFNIGHMGAEGWDYFFGDGTSNVDNINTRPDVYNLYLTQLDKVISELYDKEVGFDRSIHNFVRDHGGSVAGNVSLFKSYFQYTAQGVREFTFTNKKDSELWSKYLESQGIKHSKSSSTKIDTNNKSRTFRRNTTYKVKIDKDNG